MHRVFVTLILLMIPGVVTLMAPELGGDKKLEFRKLAEFPEFPEDLQAVSHWPACFGFFAK